MTEEQARSLLRVVRGTPDEVELAAVTAVLVAIRTEAPAERETVARSGWADRATLLRAPLSPGPDAWRRSAWPR